MRLVSFSFPYATYVDGFYSSNAELLDAAFDVQLASLEADRFPGASDALAKHLQPLGFDVHCYSPTVLPLQRAWGIEHAVEVQGPNWNLHVARCQVLRHSPDVLIIDPYAVPTSWLRELREACPSIRLVMTRYSSPKDDLSRYRECDLVVSGDRSQVSVLRAMGVNASHLHHGFDERILDVLPPRTPTEVVFFAGQIHIAEGFHVYRAQVIDCLVRSDVPVRLHVPLEETGLRGALFPHLRRGLWNLHGAMKGTPIERISELIPRLNRVKDWTHAPARSLPRNMRRRVAPPLFGMRMYSEMRQSRISLNTHGDVSEHDASNLRLWEATGVGACLLTDAKANLPELFEVDAEIVTYDSPEDCRDKASWLLDHPQQAEEIGKRGHRRVMRDHTLALRAQQLNVLIMDTL